MRRSKGFSIVEIIAVLGVLVLIGGVGYLGWKALVKSGDVAKLNASDSSAKTVKVITTKADLESAEKELSSLDFNDESSIEAEAQAGL